MDAVNRFGKDADAETWLIEQRWPNGVACLACGYGLTLKTGAVIQDSKLSLSKWAMAFYLYSTNLKGVSSVKLHRDLGITQKSAWYMAPPHTRDMGRSGLCVRRAGRG